MQRAITLCSLLLHPLTACDPATAIQLAQSGPTGPSADPPLVPADPCATYCEGYRTACDGSSFAYADYDECEQLCAYWEDVETAQNVAAQCRSKALADIDPRIPASVHDGCAEAGPDSRTCGTAYVVTCERYCDTIEVSCSTHTGFFESSAKCLSWCEGETLEGEGDTIECRLDSLTSFFLPPSCADAAPSSEVCSVAEGTVAP